MPCRPGHAQRPGVPGLPSGALSRGWRDRVTGLVTRIKAPGGSWGTPGILTAQRATPTRERPTTRCPRTSVRGFLHTCVRPGGPCKHLRAEARQEKIARCDVFREPSPRTSVRGFESWLVLPPVTSSRTTVRRVRRTRRPRGSAGSSGPSARGRPSGPPRGPRGSPRQRATVRGACRPRQRRRPGWSCSRSRS